MCVRSLPACAWPCLQAANAGDRGHADRLWLGLQAVGIVPNVTTLNLLLRFVMVQRSIARRLPCADCRGLLPAPKKAYHTAVPYVWCRAAREGCSTWFPIRDCTLVRLLRGRSPCMYRCTPCAPAVLCARSPRPNRCLSRSAAHPDEAECLTRDVCDIGGLTPNDTTQHLLAEIALRYEQLTANLCAL